MSMFRQFWVVFCCRASCSWPGRWSAGWAVARVAGCAEEDGERRDGLEQQGVDAGLLVDGAAGAELGDGAAMLVVGGELADPGGDGPGHVRARARWQGGARRGGVPPT